MNPEALRADIPALEEVVYLNTGASAATPRRVVEAATEFQQRQAYSHPTAESVYPEAWAAMDAARERAAEFVGADTGEIALTQSTVDGINTVASAIDWQPGDVVVTTDLEHPSGRLPWLRLADRHDVELRVLETERGRVDMDHVKDAVADARLLCLSSLSWNYGTQLPVAEITETAHDAGAEVLVDAVQSPGQVPVDVQEWGADYVAMAGHKWLLGVWGSGFLYVASDALERLRPDRIGYRSVQDPKAAGYEFWPDARRFELGTRSLAPYAALGEAMDVLERVGMDTVQSRVERLTDRLKDGLGDRLLSPREYDSGLVTFTAEDPAATAKRLADEGIIVRHIPDPEAVRASVHVFNTAEDVDVLLDAL
ncbi:aminotransferase class V-fold PLP-dependent enzyme [Haloarculaceae archaeon H-GB2-1]|nr:aminotransferase class V-fold PLP-dependent enzyme [Haloarculaceae archaeon H-GB1-1]MEA5406900.1 aminotransferase class V-fold PLP-dependent enzyme [Haloarculaceae archaeon H-GB2-1]